MEGEREPCLNVGEQAGSAAKGFLGPKKPISRQAFATCSGDRPGRSATVSAKGANCAAHTKSRVQEAGITEKWQLTVLMRLSQYKYMLSVNLKSASGAEEILQKATSALHRLPSTEQMLQWSDSVCRSFLKKESKLWAELGPVVKALSTYVPRAAKSLWDELSDTSLEGQADQDKDLWVCLDTHAEAHTFFSKRYILELLLGVQDLTNALSKNWMQKGM